MMKYVTHNDYDICIDYTYRQGQVDAGYNLLCKLFGQPFDGDGYKCDAEWQIEFEDGTIATIHNWKNGRNYCGAEGTPTEQMTSWCVGGYDDRALELIKGMIDDAHRITAIQGHEHPTEEGEEHICQSNH